MNLTEASVGDWVPLIEYASKRGVSLSTLRRHIKAKKINFKLEKGRYLIWDAAMPHPVSNGQSGGAPQGTSGDLVATLQRDLRRAREEIAELKTLIALYEESPPRPSGMHHE